MLRFSTVAFLQKNINSIWIIHAPAIFVLHTSDTTFYLWFYQKNVLDDFRKHYFICHKKWNSRMIFDTYNLKNLFQIDFKCVFLLPNLGHCNKWDLFGWPSSVHLPNLYQGKFIFYQRAEQKYWLLVLIFWTNLDDFFLKCSKTLCGNLKKRSKILSINLTLFLGSNLSAIVFSVMQMTLNQI